MHIKKLIGAEEEEAFPQIARIYCEIWKEPPWNESFWTEPEVIEDLRRQSAKKRAVILTATNGSADIIGFTWGYQTSIAELSQISGLPHRLWKEIIGQGIPFYVDELGVGISHRGWGIGNALAMKLMREISLMPIDCVVLRTDVKAVPARKVYKKAGFQELLMRDANHPNRTYWIKKLG
ncbi:MAG: hypothetical protein A2365_00805 [Candidatus Nealsonbacteria bacterium RIFOXYB1_FULL_40_15]|uniref:N-acetyltransferase domain-containing protein n=2 Tax=Candidatus Nealsoniibacteriota TaxID=1817911 RepID=A0A1G2EQK1_9BACT|nr:MAG: hypothetical protein A2365_00805 [Candidatus Nealsonbacteria bacterium RIFOXYB1_FULL_40_15]OGZ28063.1 MAG: hypothetical protein A2427_03285 [Candidatus Nealsonbacteria bacterium RIFOXYC1_FULL_40_7]OGZ28524.1 MAG: hypothetical protein A2562_03495 [Candidatus Nealsonbacteria bacterium RIFOXYD1_FULL_39_11]